VLCCVVYSLFLSQPVGFYINQTFENLGYGPCTSSKATSTIRTDFANGPVVIGDVDKNGVNEYIVVGKLTPISFLQKR